MATKEDSRKELTGTIWESGRHAHPYVPWVESIGLPVYRSYFIEDLRKLELAWWEERQCNAAFLQLAGQVGISEGRVTEIPPGKTLPPLKFALDEIVYVVEGRGLTTLWGGEGRPKKIFEWQQYAMFLLPRNFTHQFSNMQGDRPVRLLQYNFLPTAMCLVPDPEFFFNNPYIDLPRVYAQKEEFYSEAKIVRESRGERSSRAVYWRGNFFPNLRIWDELEPLRARGAGGHSVRMKFPNSNMSAHMSVFPAGTYKKAHRHGPGTVIIIPRGEGYSILWQEGQEKVVVPWHEASVFVPPNQWFHQHFNVGEAPARYLAFSRPRPIFDTGESLGGRQIDYVDEDPWIREKFEGELQSRGLTSLMPKEAYRDRNYQWRYQGD